MWHDTVVTWSTELGPLLAAAKGFACLCSEGPLFPGFLCLACAFASRAAASSLPCPSFPSRISLNSVK